MRLRAVVSSLAGLALAASLVAVGCDDGGSKNVDGGALFDAETGGGDTTPDTGVPDADVATPDADAATPDADAATPDADAATPDADVATPDADASTPDADASTPDADATTADTTEGGEIPPVAGAALLTWLQAGNYAAWASESAPHESEGPHFGKVRVFVNPILAASLAAGDETYPEGAAAVKELFGDTQTAIPGGWSVWVKTDADSAEGLNTFWYEIYEGSVFANAKGALICTSCHVGGADFLLTGFPLQ